MCEDDLSFFATCSLPFVLIDNSFQTHDVDCVAANNYQGASKAIRYFYSMGHRKIGYIKSKIQITSFAERFAAYKQQLKNLDIPFHPEYVIEVGYSEQEVAAAVAEYLKLHTPPTAFFADNDLLACFTIQALRTHGYAVPEDISMIGFDDRPICKLVDPPLTTIEIPQSLFGPSAVDLLIHKIQSPRQQSMKLDVGTRLIERKSVKRIL